MLVIVGQSVKKTVFQSPSYSVRPWREFSSGWRRRGSRVACPEMAVFPNSPGLTPQGRAKLLRSCIVAVGRYIIAGRGGIILPPSLQLATIQIVPAL